MRDRLRLTVFAGIAVLAVSGLAQFGAPSDFVTLLFGAVWIGLPFVPVWLGAAQMAVSDVTVWIAFAVAALSTLLIHRVVELSSQGDDSSTAGLIHIYDPILGCFAVGVVFALAWIADRLRYATTRSDPR